MPILIRPEQPEDQAGIRTLTQAAFATAAHSSQTEHLIVDALRDAGQLFLSLVALQEAPGETPSEAQRLVGHLALSPVTLSSGDTHWFGLGPVSVAPARQHHGIGSALINDALRRLRQQGAAGCVLLGDPAYYARFGFKPEPGLVLPGVPAEYFQALCLGGTVPTATVPTATVRYHAAFEVTA